MRQHPHPKNLHVLRAHDQIPEEVAQREALAQTAQAIITVYPHLPDLVISPLLALLVEPDRVETERIDNACLHKANHVDVPVEFRAAREARVGVGTYARADQWGDDVAGERVEEGGEEDLVRVERESVQV